MWQVSPSIDPFDNTNKDFWLKVEHLGRYLYVVDRLIAANRMHLCICDLGCADGYGAREMSPVAKKIIGVDLDQESINQAKSIHHEGSIDFICADITTLEIRPQVDLITAFEVLEHVDHPLETLKSMHRMLTEQGRVYCSLPNSRYEKTDENGNPSNPHHQHIFTYDEALELFAMAGFEVEEVFGQAMINQTIRKEKKLWDKKRITKRSAEIDALQDPKVIRYMASVVGMPYTVDIHESYAYVWVLKKMT